MCSVSHVTWCLPRKHQNVTTQEWQQNSQAMYPLCGNTIFRKKRRLYPTPGSVQSQAGWGPEQHRLMEGVPACDEGVWNYVIFKVLSNQTGDSSRVGIWV